MNAVWLVMRPSQAEARLCLGSNRRKAGQHPMEPAATLRVTDSVETRAVKSFGKNSANDAHYILENPRLGDSDGFALGDADC